eukprot:TRINITY_DN52917_c0_g1_i1.p1 TRINITY_DN52917_c0_g1~~TRINITY_DN52917_c0_g1_i1.p1  ORF type:complete len:131 (-),score=49.51 TRINITY_DN52917_c0_g1_i1:149-541(-)
MTAYFVCFFFFSSRRRHTRCREVSWARRCVQETVSTQSTWGVKKQKSPRKQCIFHLMSIQSVLQEDMMMLKQKKLSILNNKGVRLEAGEDAGIKFNLMVPPDRKIVAFAGQFKDDELLNIGVYYLSLIHI